MSANAAAAVELRHVTKRFGPHVVLDDVSLTVAPGRSVCILGKSGTGKSVALKHMVGLLQPDAGQVLIEGEDITGMNSRELSRIRRRIGFLFQNAALFDSITVGDNVAFPLQRHTTMDRAAVQARVKALLLAVGLAHEHDKMPADLSGGMRKRAGLARALALDPAIVLVDEPSAGLDPITAGEIDQLLLGLQRQGGTTLVVVTHNIPSARTLADEMIVLHQGKIHARGTPDELEKADEPLVRAFMRSAGTG
jgi:phospholipid/cholesterol/gamma-HCH transport system ATP-binding protein